MSHFAVELVYGPDRARLEEVRPAHREYAKRLAEEGVLLAGGPWADDSGAMLVYSATDVDELRGVLDADPYTPAGVIEKVTIREWTPRTGQWL
ncbi:YciI family protein [Streptoalloteichus hindustanus]|uniref:YCII-related domain-containing protein n=1 Tax=Streptoalloteichus hindustanus TaxID=2017 RepID=A0A1M4UFZ0_STRHI|nr:YciI family protein [Streptoalloteichus hindustanus]SHE55605.1 hypothetical protein SAMN05444320_101409 [Streptoalloteichus hindustanus]